MISEPTLAGLDWFFTLVYKYRFGFLNWDKNERQFLNYGSDKKWGRQLLIWWSNNILLEFKGIFLVHQFRKLLRDGTMAMIVLQTVFIMTFGAAIFHNLLLWKYREQIPHTFSRFARFSRNAQAKYMENLNKPYPVQDDGLGKHIRTDAALIVVFSISIFFLSMNYPAMAPFFGKAFPDIVENYYACRVIGSLVEAYITAFGWTSNIVVITLMPNCANLITFWLSNLNKVNESSESCKYPLALGRTYRELQLLMLELNECFANQAFCLFWFAFGNQVMANYGTIRLYNKLSFASWIGCPHLSINGTINLFQVQGILAAPAVQAEDTLKSWQSIQTNKKGRFDRVLKSCPVIKMRHGEFNHFQKDSGIEWFDSVIDKTVTVILWQTS